MVVAFIQKLIIILLALQGFFFGGSFSHQDLHGTWKGEHHNGIIRFNNDGTFNVEHPFEDEGIFISKGGNWMLFKSMNNKIQLDINTEGYSTNWEVSGTRGIFELMKPWRLYYWQGDPDEGVRHSFFKTNLK